RRHHGPASGPQVPTGGPGLVTRAEARGLRVLVVDDEPPARNELAFLLRQLPQIELVSEAADADECLARLDKATFDAIMLDVRMPVTVRNQILLLPSEQIRLAWIEGDQVMVRTSEGRYPTRLNLTDFEARFEGRGFLRVHRRYVVNLRHVVSIEGFFNGT